ncbi:biopolymer transporter ExbB [Gemmobacter sp. JM10B15]|uniref:Biopolymer transporter ExbB n=2 Tax=Gemmobacter denitrificans TaxID=3123040 RepID=A0ABU8BVW8_9RHOB
MSRSPAPLFTQPIRQITLMLLVLGMIAAGAWVALPMLRGIIAANPLLNGTIIGVFGLGVLTCFWQVWQLAQSVSWIDAYVQDRPGSETDAAPRLLAPLAALLGPRTARLQLSSSSTRSILDSIATRIDEARDITRYLANLLIFLGLLGTFYGLATTVPAIVDTIRGLSPQEGENSLDIFGKLMSGLETQLGGMGTAFSSSLLGLAGSLVVGLLELFAGHGQNRFFREMEEWLSSITRIGVAEGDGGDMGALAQVLDQLSQQIDNMQMLFTQSDISRSLADERTGELAEAVARLASRLDSEATIAGQLQRIADGQERLLAAMSHNDSNLHADAEARMRLRSMDVQLLRILEELSAGRQESTADLRGDLSALTQAVRQLGRGA